MSSTFENMCRMCMLNETKSKAKLKSSKMVSILSIHEQAKEKLKLLELIKSTVPQLRIDENDQLPKNVCQECSEKIKDIYNFQQNCINNEKKFYKMLKEQDDDTMNEFNEAEEDREDDEEDFKTEFEDTFIEEHSMKSDDELIMEEEINKAAEASEEFITSCSDLSIDLVWNDDDKSDPEWDTKQTTSKMKKCDKTAYKNSNTELLDDDLFNIFCEDEIKEGGGNCVKDDKKFKTQTTATAKNSGITKEMIATGIYPCPRCKRKLKTKLSFIKHQEMHEQKDLKEGPYECNICSKVFRFRSILKTHRRTHIGERPFLCSECGKGFVSAGSLKQHSFRHLEERQFPCPDCPRSFPTKTDMLSHYDIHKAKPRNHVCDVCGRGFYKPYLLKQHKMYHNNERPYACEYCDKRFVTREKVTRHTRIHTGEKPYKCNYCERSYCQSSELMKHLRTHLGDNIYQCELCPEKLPTVKLLRSHFATHKNDDEEAKAANLAAFNALVMKGMFVK